MIPVADLASAFRSGALVVYPTETVYGIGTALSAGDSGVARIRAAKGSPPGRPFGVLAADIDSAFELWRDVTGPARRLGSRAWPGPLTLVGPARVGLPSSLLGDVGGVSTISVRVPGDPWLLGLLRAIGEPIVSTSANRAGEPPPIRYEDIDLDSLAPDLAVDRGGCRGGVPSTLVSMLQDPPELLRAGAFPWPE